MAFKRTSFKSLVRQHKEYFASAYKLSNKIKWELDSECYVLMLGLENGFYETPTHTIQPHKIGDKTIGFNGSNFGVTIKCKGFDEEGNHVDSLCCKLYQLEKERGATATNRCLNYSSTRVQIPILVLGNSLTEERKVYPVSKVSILNSLKSEKGLIFSYLDMASSSFSKDIIQAYGKKLKEEGVLDYEADENSEEYLDDIRQRLTRTVIKIKAVKKEGFKQPIKEYSFFPFENPAIASQSPQGERESIINYTKVPQIMEKVNEYLTLFDVEVDNMFNDWTEKDLQEYYNSFIGANIKDNVKVEETTEKVEFVDNSPRELTEEDMALLDETEEEIPVEPVKVQPTVQVKKTPTVEVKPVQVQPTVTVEQPKPEIKKVVIEPKPVQPTVTVEQPQQEWEEVQDVAQVETDADDFNFDLDDDAEFFAD